MNDLEKNIIYVEQKIEDSYKIKRETENEKINTSNKRKNKENEAKRYTSKLKRLNRELENLKVKNISKITVPVFGVIGLLLSVVFTAPIALTAASTLVAACAGYRLTGDLIKYKMINEKDELLLSKLFPTIEGKIMDIDEVSLQINKLNSELETLINDEKSLTEKNEELNNEIESLKNVKDSLCSLHFKKLQREYLPYYTQLEDVLNKTIDDPQEFYKSICRVLTNEERKDIVFDMEGRKCENCQNHTCRLTKEEKEKMSNCKAWYNEEEIGKSKVLRR